jgi:S-adenosylmethionine synthetase
MQSDFIFSSESVTRGHPDKMCDQISDRIVAGYLRHDPDAQVAAEAALSTGIVFSSVRFSSKVAVDTASLVREAIADAGYADGRFNARSCTVMSSHIEHEPTRAGPSSLVGASDQIIDQLVAAEHVNAFGFACNHTRELMPLPISLANKLARRLDSVRQDGTLPYLTPDGKAQVAVEFKGGRPKRIFSVLINAGQRHESERKPGQMEEDVRAHVLPAGFDGEEIRPDAETRIFVTGSGKGGPYVHAGLTGRKGAADTYGEYARRTDSALSGKDPTRVERIGSYAARYAAKHVIAAGIAEQCEVQLSYIAGLPGPVSVIVETFGTAKLAENEIAKRLRRSFDFRIGALCNRFKLVELEPEDVYPRLAVYGHFGRTDLALPWERLDSVDSLRS